MPIIALFDKKKFHLFAGNTIAQAQMNEAMIRECKLHGYTGFQFDFENIDWIDRDRLTDMVRTSAEALHKAGLQLTIATVPNAPGYPGAGGFAKWIYTDWRGAYDIAAIAKYVDLLCLMTYDQTTRWTMPGPVAAWDWTVENLNYALKVVPKEKLSLGIPLYGYHWYTGTPTKETELSPDKPNPTAEYIGTPNALVCAGGVAANQAIRKVLHRVAFEVGTELVAPPPALCTDNAAMIAWAGAERLVLGLTDPLDIAPRARWPLDAVAKSAGEKIAER